MTKNEENAEKDICIICLDKLAVIRMNNCCQKLLFCQMCYEKYTKEKKSCPICYKNIEIGETEPKITKNTYIKMNKAGYLCTGLFFFILLCGILSMNYYFIYDAHQKWKEAEKELKENIIESICNTTRIDTCSIKYNQDGILYRVCLENICINPNPCVNPNKPLKCFYIKDDLRYTLTIDKNNICHENKNRYCQNIVNKEGEFNMFLILLGMFGTIVILIPYVFCTGFLCFNYQTENG